MNSATVYRAQERQITAHSWGIASEIPLYGIPYSGTVFGGNEEKHPGFGSLVQLSQLAFHPGYSNTGMKLLRNIELVDIVFKGRAGFQDSTGAVATFPENTVQVISAGKGMYISEFNAAEQGVLEKLQIRFLPAKLNSNTVHTKALFNLGAHKNELVALISPHVDSSTLSVRQKAAILLGHFDAGKHFLYDVNGSTTGLFLFVVDGIVTVGDKILNKSDAMTLYPAERIAVTFAQESVLLLIEIEILNEENL